MAPRRSAGRLLARPGRAAGAGVAVPALAVAAVLALAGCGGGGSSPGAAAPTGTAATAAEADGEGGAAAKQGKDADGGQAQAEKGGNTGSEGRHGPKVSQPKGEPEKGITPQQRRKATTANVTLASPKFQPGAPLPAVYTCDGADRSPPLQWSGLPAEAAELVLLVLNLRPVDQSLFFDWAVAGLDPSLASLEEGKLPAGAVAGKNSFGRRGYSICPQKGGGENYIFMLYAIPKALSPKPGFDPLELREAVLAEHGNVGLLGTSYARP